MTDENNQEEVKMGVDEVEAAAPVEEKTDEGRTQLLAPVFDPTIESVEFEDVDMVLPSGTNGAMEREIARIEAEDKPISSRDEYEYQSLLNAGYRLGMRGGVLWRATQGKRADGWRQYIDSEAGPIGLKAPKFKDTGTRVSGEKALLRARSLLGQGGQFTVPLFHSGFHVTLSSPNESDILAFHSRMVNDRITLGRRIAGAALANDSAYTTRLVMDFIRSHMVDTTLVDGVESVYDQMSALDIQVLAWAMACLMFRTGFNYARAVISDDPTANIVQSGRVNITKLCHTDSKALTPKQVMHMSRTSVRASKEALDVYRSEFTRGQPRMVDLNANIRVRLRVPTATQHIDAGIAWVDSVVNMVDEAFEVNGGENERNLAINKLSKASQMRQYDHYVDAIYVRNPNAGEDEWEEFLRDDDYTIEMLLADWSSDDEIRTNFYKAVRDFMDDATISLIAVTVASEEEEKIAPKHFAKLFPIDAVAVFIALLSRRVQLIEQRGEL